MILIADNINAMNPVVSEAMKRFDPKPIQELAIRCEKAGAQFIDINPGYLSPKSEDAIIFLVESVQEVTSVRLMLDSPNARVLAKGLASCREKPLLDAVSLEEQKLKEILPLAAEHGTSVVLLLMDEKSFPPSGLEDKMAIAIEIREHAIAAGVRHKDLIFDPVLPNLRWHDAFQQVSEVVKAVRMLSEGTIFPEPASTMVGLSNLRSGLQGHYPLHVETTCMSVLAGAGLGYALANALQREIVESYRIIQQIA